jgi:hypothetical protein
MQPAAGKSTDYFRAASDLRSLSAPISSYAGEHVLSRPRGSEGRCCSRMPAVLHLSYPFSSPAHPFCVPSRSFGTPLIPLTEGTVGSAGPYLSVGELTLTGTKSRVCESRAHVNVTAAQRSPRTVNPLFFRCI